MAWFLDRGREALPGVARSHGEGLVCYRRARPRLRAPRVAGQSVRAVAATWHSHGFSCGAQAVDPKLKHNEPGTRGARRITHSRIKSALQTLGPKETNDGSIHAARKELKR